MKKIKNFTKIGITIVFLFVVLTYSASAAGKFNVPLNWVLGPTGTSVDDNNDGFFDTVFISDNWVNSTGDKMTGSLIGLNLNMTYGNFSKGMIVLGNVGIGKTSPNYKLDVLGSINATNINATGIIQATTFIGSGSSLTGISSTTPPWNSSGANVFLNDSTANVGIGTASPYNELVVVGSVGVSGSLNASSINTTGSAYFATSSGSVGIGQTSPNYKLDVLGSINVTNLNATGIVQATTFIGSGSSLTGINTDFTNNSDINVTRFVANNTLFVNDSRVGIGTASPDTLLHIQDTSSGTLGVGAVLLKVEAISNGYSSAIEMKARQNDGTQKSMFFEYNAQQNGITIQNNSGSRLVHFDNDGNVGIGTVAPVQKLTVDGGQIIVGDATFSTTASSSGLGNSLIIGADTGGGHTWIQAKSAGNNYITFSTTPDGGTTAEYMRITKTGDICDQGNDADLSDCASDIRLKENINSYGYGLDEVLQLNPVEFNWNEAAVQEWGYTPNITILGLVAQEVEEVIPEWVVDNSYGYKKVDGAGNLKYLLVKAVQELNTKHEQKDTEISELKQQNQALKQAVCELNPTAEICQ